LENNAGQNKILFVTRCLPYEQGGTPVGLRNLFQNFSPDQLIVLGRTVDPKKKLEKNSIRYKMVEIPTPQIKGMRLWRFLSVIPGFIQGLWLIRKYKVKKLVGVYPDEGSLLLSYMLAKATGIEYYPYFFDLYKEFIRNNWQDKVASWLQNRTFKRAHKVIVLTDGMREYIQKTYSLKAHTVPNVINSEISVKNFATDYVKGGRKFRIAYSGTINADRLDTMQEFAKMAVNNPDYEIYYYTSQSKDYLSLVGLMGDNTIIKFCKNQEELVNELANADLLYLPLSFDTTEDKRPNMMTCFGTKTYEYLITGKPLLIHSPANYFNYQFLKQNECAYLLSSKNVAEINNFFNWLFENYRDTAGDIVNNAFKTAAQFKGNVIAEKLKRLLF